VWTGNVGALFLLRSENRVFK